MDIENKANLEKRVEKAVELFKEGYNCSQSVFCAFADLYGVDRDLAFRVSASFGGGIGRMRQTCGAACGLFMLAGLKTGSTVGADAGQKRRNYQEVQKLAERFKTMNGSLICAELLGINPKPLGQMESTPEVRTAEYYKKRPCIRMIENAAKLWVEYMEEQEK